MLPARGVRLDQAAIVVEDRGEGSGASGGAAGNSGRSEPGSTGGKTARSSIVSR